MHSERETKIKFSIKPVTVLRDQKGKDYGYSKEILITALLLVATFRSVLHAQTSKQSTSNLKYVDPTIGNVAPLLNPNRPMVHFAQPDG